MQSQRRSFVFGVAGAGGGAGVVAAWVAMIDIAGIQTPGPGLVVLICIFGPVMAAGAVAERRLGYEGLATGVMAGFVIGLLGVPQSGIAGEES